jgi:hypothetical protein
MKRIDFSHDWNRAGDSPSGKLGLKCFSTIRRAGDYHRVGEQYEVWLRDTPIFIAEIVYIKHFFLADLNEAMARLDTGYGVEDCKKIMHKMWGKYGDVDSTLFAFIVLKRLETDNQTTEEIEV